MVLHFPYLKYSSKWFFDTSVVRDMMELFYYVLLAIGLQISDLLMLLAGWSSFSVEEVSTGLHI